MNNRQLFLQNLAQTSNLPLLIDVERADGSYIYSSSGKKYLDLISGISVSNVGHCNPKVVTAIKEQADKYLHVMVYGEFVQSPQVKYATALLDHLTENLNCVYFTNSGTEATEGAMKLAKRFTGRSEIVAFRNAYHGSTQGALSISGNESLKNSFRPLLPGIKMLDYNSFEDVSKITSSTAAVFIEPLQGEAGALLSEPGFLQAIRQRCNETGTLLVFDEIQSGFGRTGSLFAFQQEGVEPDILLAGKALGGGLPLGAFISSRGIMGTLTHNPVLGHITTFGGHPLSCAAGLAAHNVLTEENVIESVPRKEKLFRENLNHPKIKGISGRGLLLAVYFSSFEEVQKVIGKCFENGVITDWFLFNNTALRLAPPLTISDDEIFEACRVINAAAEKVL